MKPTVRNRIFITVTALAAVSCASAPAPSPVPEEARSGHVRQAEEAGEQPAEERHTEKAVGITLSLVSSPKETTKNKDFAAPFVIKAVSQDGAAVPSFGIAVSYPSSRENGEIVLATAEITTDESGTASFLPPTPKYSFSSQASFFPAGDMGDGHTAENASERAVSAPFKVQTNLKAAGGVIAVVDLTQSGRASSNPVSSSNLLMTMMRLGFTQIGNAPVEIMNLVPAGDDAKIHARAKAMLGASQNFLIYGTVRTDSSERTGSGFSCTLTGTVRAASMRTGEIMFVTERTLTATGASEAAALANARKTLAEELAGEIRYGI